MCISTYSNLHCVLVFGVCGGGGGGGSVCIHVCGGVDGCECVGVDVWGLGVGGVARTILLYHT